MTPDKSVPDKGRELLEEMRQRFPVLAENKPIAVRSGDRIAEAMGHSPRWRVHSMALEMYTGKTAYLRTILAGGVRYDPITGEPDGEITERQQQHALERLLQKQARLLRTGGKK